MIELPGDTLLPPIVPVQPEKLELIDSIVQQDKKAFDEWIGEPGQARSLNLSHGAARYLLIPERYLELADDPRAVDVLVDYQDEQELFSYIFEHKKEPVTNQDDLHTFFERRKENSRLARNHQPYTPNELPNTVDMYHTFANVQEFIQEGKMSLQDYIAFRIALKKDTSTILRVDEYTDRAELRFKGIASSFYQRLPSLAKQIGFRFILGVNDERNLSFFTKKLKRRKLSELKNDRQTEFHDSTNDFEDHTLFYTIDFLYPEDEQIYLK